MPPPPPRAASPFAPLSGNPTAGPPVTAADERFGRAARLVADVRYLVKQMAADTNSARAYREQCSAALGAALATSLALQEALGSGGAGSRLATAHPAALLYAGSEVAVAVSRAQGLVHKYGAQGPLEALLRRAGRGDDVDAKFRAAVRQLNAIEDNLWRHIDPGNRLRREMRPAAGAGAAPGTVPTGGGGWGRPPVAPAEPQGQQQQQQQQRRAAAAPPLPQLPLQQQPPVSLEPSSSGATSLTQEPSLPPGLPAVPPRASHVLSRRKLRCASQHKCVGVAWFPDAADEAGDGCAAWAAHRAVKVVNLGNEVTTVIHGAGDGLTAFCPGAAGERPRARSAAPCSPTSRAPPLPRVLGPAARRSRSPTMSLPLTQLAGLIWSGHEDGALRVWSLDAADAAAPPLRLGDAPVTAVAADPDTGFAWVGNAAGEVSVVRCALAPGPRAVGPRSWGSRPPGAAARRLAACSCAGVDAPTRGPPPFPRRRLEPNAAGNALGRLELVRCLRDPEVTSPGGPPPRRSSGAGAGLGLASCFGGAAGARAPDARGPHAGPVRAILLRGGRAYTSGGGGRGAGGPPPALMVWDAATGALLRAVTKKSTQWMRSPAGAIAAVDWARVVRGLAGGVPAHVLTGHDNGQVVMWDLSGDNLRPVLVLGKGRSGVVGLGVVEELGLLAAGHANGRVRSCRAGAAGRFAWLRLRPCQCSL
jgi:hypothetical protein